MTGAGFSRPAPVIFVQRGFMRTQFVNWRRSAAPLTACKRAHLADGGGSAPAVSAALLRELKRFDRDLELYWHPIRKRWILYRLVVKAATPSEDQLIKEYELAGPRGEYRSPGMWLIDWLRRNDKTRGGAIDPRVATREYVRHMTENDEQFWAEKEQAAADISESTAKEILDYATGREVVHVNRG